MVTFGAEPALLDAAWDQGLYRVVLTGDDDHPRRTAEVGTMAGLLKHKPKTVEPVDVFDRFDHMFDD